MVALWPPFTWTLSIFPGIPSRFFGSTCTVVRRTTASTCNSYPSRSIGSGGCGQEIHSTHWVQRRVQKLIGPRHPSIRYIHRRNENHHLSWSLSLFNACAYGWGALWHEAIGYIDIQFLSPKALSFVQYSLGTTYNGTLGVAAPWADTVHYEAAFSWSASFHSVDAQGWFWHYDSSHLDNPPTSCSVSQTRDYANETCILTAIANYTTRVLDTSLSATQSQDALKFLGYMSRSPFMLKRWI